MGRTASPARCGQTARPTRSTVYTNATIPTPGVTYTYDPVYPRVLTMVDGIGTTTYAYKAPGVLGAGQVASVDGPLANDTITYTYDQLGRVTVRAINGAANTESARDPRRPLFLGGRVYWTSESVLAEKRAQPVDGLSGVRLRRAARIHAPVTALKKT